MFSVKAVCLRVSALRGSVTVFVVLEVLVNSRDTDNSVNSPRLILLKEFVNFNSHVGIYRGHKFCY